MAASARSARGDPIGRRLCARNAKGAEGLLAQRASPRVGLSAALGADIRVMRQEVVVRHSGHATQLILDPIISSGTWRLKRVPQKTQVTSQRAKTKGQTTRLLGDQPMRTGLIACTSKATPVSC
jgi:hypothetical protein